MINNSFLNNSANIYGGAVYALLIGYKFTVGSHIYTINIIIKKSNFTNNSAKVGGGIVLDYSYANDYAIG